jgi:hypothetical protein
VSQRPPSRFLLGSAAVGVVGCLGAAVTPIAAGASAAFTGSIVTSGLLGVLFAVRNAQLLRRDGRVSVAAAGLTTVFGGWFMAAPLVYDVGFLATGGTQFVGMLITTFTTYMLVSGLTGEHE